MRSLLFFTALLAAFWPGAHAAAQDALHAPQGTRIVFTLDSGPLDNPSPEARTAFSHKIDLPDHAWIRLHFDHAILAPGSFVRITSLLDHESQSLDASDLDTWSWSSAYFNGGSVLLELVAAPFSKHNRISLDAISTESSRPAQRGVPGACGICAPDNRNPSSQPWAARLLPAGCSAAIFCEDSSLVSAGHCVQAGMIVQFNVPPSLPSCSVVHPPVADQFPVVHVRWDNSGAGADWAVIRTGINSLGQTAHQRQQGVRRPAESPAALAQNTLVYAYGSDDACARTHTQQFSPGAINAITNAVYRFNNDVRPGSSGAALLVADRIVGVVTHCSTTCTNTATRIDVPAFADARNAVAACDDSHAINVHAHGAEHVPLAVTIDDAAGSAQHTTPFAATFLHYTSVTIEAPPSVGEACFARWTLNNAPVAGRSLAFMVTGPADAVAHYEPCCPCDWDRDAVVNSADFFAFLDAFFTGSGDLNADGVTDSQDFFAFLACFFGAC